MAGLSGRVSGGLELFTQFRYLKVKDHKVERFNTTAGALDSVSMPNTALKVLA